jgi:hypothetical protein
MHTSGRRGAHPYRAPETNLRCDCRRPAPGTRPLACSPSPSLSSRHCGRLSPSSVAHSIPRYRGGEHCLGLLRQHAILQAQWQPVILPGGDYQRTAPTLHGDSGRGNLPTLHFYYALSRVPQSVPYRTPFGLELHEGLRTPHLPQFCPSTSEDGRLCLLAGSIPPPSPGTTWSGDPRTSSQKPVDQVRSAPSLHLRQHQSGQYRGAHGVNEGPGSRISRTRTHWSTFPS